MFTRVNQSDLMAFSPNVQKFPVDSAFNVSYAGDEAATVGCGAAQVDDGPDAINLAPSQGKT